MRFDFDSEAAIRLCWLGVRPINVATPVRYFHRDEGGVSHFKYLRDNLLLAGMYARLFAALMHQTIAGAPISRSSRAVSEYRPRNVQTSDHSAVN